MGFIGSAGPSVEAYYMNTAGPPPMMTEPPSIAITETSIATTDGVTLVQFTRPTADTEFFSGGATNLIFSFSSDNTPDIKYHASNRGRLAVDFGLGCDMRQLGAGGDFSDCMALSPTYNLYWSENEATEEVSFMMEAWTTGFVGVGFSRSGAMAMSDLVSLIGHMRIGLGNRHSFFNRFISAFDPSSSRIVVLRLSIPTLHPRLCMK